MIRPNHCLVVISSVVMLIATFAGLNAFDVRAQAQSADDGTRRRRAPVQALFNLAHPDEGPFPADIFTLDDPTHNTRRRVNLPYPDCAVRVSDCEDLRVINTLDGFGLQPRLSIPFDGPIDVETVTSDAVFLLRLGSPVGGGDADDAVVGINQSVWDALTNTLHVESDALLAQHTRYALIVTNRLHDAEGQPVDASGRFRRFRRTVGGEYTQALLEAIHAAERLGVPERDVVTVSVFTTQSITSVMERIRDQIKSATPDPANFSLGPKGERTVFKRTDVASVSWRQHTTVDPAGFTTAPIDLAVLDVVPGAVETIAYGTYVSPNYLVRPGDYIPAVGTLAGTPPVQSQETLHFTLFLPSGPKPPKGWPVTIVGAPTARHVPMGALASKLASRGIATIGIHTAGCAFGPLSALTINLTRGGSLTIPDGGRSYDQDGNNIIGGTEGSVAARPRAWTIGERDGYRQTAIDLMQLVRVIEVGVDVDGDGSRWGDLDPGRIFHFGNSAGAMHGTMFLALEPNVQAAVESVPGGMSPEHARWSPVRRPALGAALQSRTPSLINASGLTAIDGVAVDAPHFDENKPLRNLTTVANWIQGAVNIQRAFEMHEWGQESGQNPIVWAPYLRTKPLPGLAAKPVLYLSARGDQQANNPGTTALLRSGNLTGWTVQYRHDLAFAVDGTMPKNPHQIAVSPMHANATFRAISRAVQDQIASFFVSGGTTVIHPNPAWAFEVPVQKPLSENLNYIR